MVEVSKEELRERLGNIDQIRDIIVGPKLREYDSRIEQIESDISMLQQEMRDRFERVKSELSADLRVGIDALEKKLKCLNLNFDEENAALNQQLERVNKKFSHSIEALDRALDHQTASIRQDLSSTKSNLEEDIQTLKSDIFSELEKRFSKLTQAKVSRDDMAEVLFELGMRMKETELVPKLKAAVDTDSYEKVLLLEHSNTK